MGISFLASGRGKALCPPDPDYPEGIVLMADVAKGTPTCRFDLPYPAPECGMWEVKCDVCGISIMVTAAGRVDDPKAIILPCEMKAKMN